MSLFGTSPPDSAASHSRNRSSLFDDEPGNGSGSLFDDDESGKASPWDMPTPRKAARRDAIRTLLRGATIPKAYSEVFASVREAGSDADKITLTGVQKILDASGLEPGVKTKLLGIIVPVGREGETGVTREEVNVLLALIGLAQEGEDATLDGVDERRKNLPVPELDLSTGQPAAKASVPAKSPAKSQPPATPEPQRKDTLEDGDPWGTPTKATPAAPRPEPPAIAHRSSSFTPVEPATTRAPEPQSVAPAAGEGGWGGYSEHAAEFGGSFAGTPAEHPPFGEPAPGQNPFNPAARSTLPRTQSTGSDEVITITVLPEKEGLFMFQHRNYQVFSPRRSSKVVRRYSDFVWLLDCLHKRYPFRQLPLLPPKRVAVNGRHLSSDLSFIEKRRRGLVRFCNTLVRHPALAQEQLVVMFLTVPTELSVWRKQATISVQEEFTGRELPEHLEDSLPPKLQETFETVRSGVRRAAEIYIGLCQIMERLSKRNEGMAAEYMRFSLGLQSVTDTFLSAYSVENDDISLINDGLLTTGKHLVSGQGLLIDEARAWDEGVLEDLKRHRDTLVSMRELFDRRDKLAKDNIPQLEQRIQNNENKLTAVRNKAPELIKPGEIEKLEEAIIKDKQSIVAQHARGVFIKECVKDEINLFQHSQYRISRLHQDWSQERVKYAELQADNWRSLAEQMEGLPTGE